MSLSLLSKCLFSCAFVFAFVAISVNSVKAEDADRLITVVFPDPMMDMYGHTTTSATSHHDVHVVHKHGENHVHNHAHNHAHTQQPVDPIEIEYGKSRDALAKAKAALDEAKHLLNQTRHASPMQFNAAKPNPNHCAENVPCQSGTLCAERSPSLPCDTLQSHSQVFDTTHETRPKPQPSSHSLQKLQAIIAHNVKIEEANKVYKDAIANHAKVVKSHMKFHKEHHTVHNGNANHANTNANHVNTNANHATAPQDKHAHHTHVHGHHLGDFCDYDGQCETTFCNAVGRCSEKRLPEGSYCSHDDDCDSRKCDFFPNQYDYVKKGGLCSSTLSCTLKNTVTDSMCKLFIGTNKSPQEGWNTCKSMCHCFEGRDAGDRYCCDMIGGVINEAKTVCVVD